MCTSILSLALRPLEELSSNYSWTSHPKHPPISRNCVLESMECPPSPIKSYAMQALNSIESSMVCSFREEILSITMALEESPSMENSSMTKTSIESTPVLDSFLWLTMGETLIHPNSISHSSHAHI